MEGLRVDEEDVDVGTAGDGCVGQRTSQLRSAAMRCAREVAQRYGKPLEATFRDTLSGDLARLQVWRRLRRLFPDLSLAEVDPVLDEALSP